MKEGRKNKAVVVVVVEESKEEDRLSALPDTLIYHVLSFLDMRVVVKTCILSTKWRYFWLSTPTLNFDNDGIDCDSPRCSLYGDCGRESCNNKIDGFGDFVNRVLFLTKCNIVNFKLISTRSEIEPAHVYSWLIAALGLKSRNVVIGVTLCEPLKIPDHLFTSNVEALKLSCYSMHTQTRLPTTMSKSAQLKNLELNCLLFPDGNAEGELILSFSVLEDLVIWNCNVTHLNIISIAAPLLKSLDVAHVYTENNYSCKVKMCAPKLKSVKPVTDLDMSLSPVEFCMENPSSLISTHISICSCDDKDSARAFAVKCWTKVMSWAYNVQILKLVTASVQGCHDPPISYFKYVCTSSVSNAW